MNLGHTVWPLGAQSSCPVYKMSCISLSPLSAGLEIAGPEEEEDPKETQDAKTLPKHWFKLA